MYCRYFVAGQCRSCTSLATPYAAQLAQKQSSVEAALGKVAADAIWDEPYASTVQGFRNKAKAVVAGRRGRPTLGILDGAGRGVDLRHCPIHEPALAEALPVLADIVAQQGFSPYDVPGQRGELKYLLVTSSPAGELMVRFVLRSRDEMALVEGSLEQLPEALPGVRVVSVNVHPAHKAVIEGEEELTLTTQQTLPMDVGAVRLHLRPRSFFQTNTAVASALYRQATHWANRPRSVLDLYCGVGGFALHLAVSDQVQPQVRGVEESAEAIDSARRSAADLGVTADFSVGDATGELTTGDSPELVIVNPPRRGIGADLAARLNSSDVSQVLYSSCHPQSLAKDLAAMPSLRVTRARVFDMFPHTGHAEVLVDLRRR